MTAVPDIPQFGDANTSLAGDVDVSAGDARLSKEMPRLPKEMPRLPKEMPRLPREMRYILREICSHLQISGYVTLLIDDCI